LLREPGGASWSADWRMTLFVVLMLPLVVGLGFWQLERAAYKQGLMDAYFDKLGALPVPLAADPTPFTRVRVRGSYLPIQLLLDNQIDAGTPGYWVYAPFTADGVTWLVNRGWVAGPRLRTDLPVVPELPQGEVTIVALAWPDTGMLPLFGEESIRRVSADIVRMQRLDIAALNSRYARKSCGSRVVNPVYYKRHHRLLALVWSAIKAMPSSGSGWHLR